MTTTEISNSFTGYEATIRTKGLPAISTLRKHLRKAKASDCISATIIKVDGAIMEIVDSGRGDQLVRNPNYATQSEIAKMEAMERAFYL